MERKDFLRLVALITVAGSAAASFAGDLKGKIVDSSTAEGLIQASVRVLSPKDSTAVKGAVTSSTGSFSIENLKPGKYIVEASYVGYSTEYRNINMTEATMRLQPFKLAETSIALKDAVVTGIRTPIKVMEDTVEYSAESYKTQPNAVVEDLLKRLPGVEVGSDGKITANGKEVTKILIDGLAQSPGEHGGKAPGGRPQKRPCPYYRS